MVIVPDRGSKAAAWLLAWEFFLSVLMLGCAYVIPFSLALPMVTATGPVGFLDCFFSMDITLNFFIAVRLPAEGHSDTIWERDICKIGRRYCAIPFSDQGRAGWFWVDAISVLPGWLQLCGVGDRFVTVLKVVRFLRLLRMARLGPMVRKLEECQARTGLPFVVSDCLKFIFVTTFVSHVAACVWVMVEGKVSLRVFATELTERESWLSALRNAKGDCCEPDAESDPLCVYNLALYWAVMTLTTVGYGDITPQVPLEYFVCTVFMLVAGFVWAYIVGSVVSLLSQLDPHNARFKQCMDELNILMNQRHVPSPLRRKLREYMLVSKNLGQVHHHQRLLEDNLSGGLQREVVLETPVTQTILRKVFWAKDLEQDALLEIMRSLKSYWYSPNETIPMDGKMIVIREGIIAVKGRVLGRNEVYGQNSIILLSDQLANEAMPRTLSYVNILVLTKTSLREACELYPSADRRLRTAQVRTAVWRGFVESAMRLKRTGHGVFSTHSVHEPPARSGFAASVNAAAHGGHNCFLPGAGENSVKEVEQRLRRGQKDLADQLAELRQLVESRVDIITTALQDFRQHAPVSKMKSAGRLS